MIFTGITDRVSKIWNRNYFNRCYTWYGTAQYDFQFISMVVIDDYGKGLPVAWAISNREDVSLLVQILKAVHAQVGRFETNYFMSDCAEQCINAWCSVFSCENTHKFLCIWHVDCAWRSALN